MGTKRHHEEDGAPVESEASGTSTKRQKSYPGKKRKAQDDSGAKKRARAIERALRRNENLPADVRTNLQRELASQKQIAEDKAYRKKRSAMISRYHMVRFFERKKASRLAKQLKRKMERETDPAEIAKIERELHIAQVDEAYTQYFPHMETYVGLYSASAKTKHEEREGGHEDGERDGDDESKEAAAKAALEAERPPMWAVIEKAMKEGPRALERLRDRRSPDDSGDKIYTRPPTRPKSSAPAGKPAPQQSNNGHREERSSYNKPGSGKDKNGDGAKTELNRRERRRLMRESGTANNDKDGEEEEGGFFEEL